VNELKRQEMLQLRRAIQIAADRKIIPPHKAGSTRDLGLTLGMTAPISISRLIRLLGMLPAGRKPDNPELGNPTGAGKDKPTKPNDPAPEDGPTNKGDNTEVDGTLPDPPSPPETGCFIGETPVLMADGLTKRIDAIAIGDQILTRDEQTGLMAVGAVERVFRHHVAETLLLQIDEGEVVETTAEHRFAAEKRGFVGAGQLLPGDRLSTHNARTARIVSMVTRTADVTVYNISVDQFHTFFIGCAGLWVHNVKKADPQNEPGS